MKDVQSSPDTRGIAIDRVGVSQLKLPIVVWDKTHERQSTVAEMSLSVDLPHHFKGTHMSRFVEVINDHRGEFTMATFPTILRHLQERLEARKTHVEACFPYFLNKAAPVSGAEGMIDYACTFFGEADGERIDFQLQVEVPVTSLCPCSKEISAYGAHNQRSRVTVRVDPGRKDDGSWEMVWIEDVIAVVEASASAPLYSLLKRPDEKYVTELAYDNPVFVEDLARNVAGRLVDDPRLRAFMVKCVNEESIHNHNAFAEIFWERE